MKSSVFHLLLILAISGSAIAQRKAQSPGSSYDPRPFNSRLDKLPPNYEGHSFYAIYDALVDRSEVSRKSEFESTGDYNKRMVALAGRPLFGQLKRDSLLAFSIGSYDTEQIVTMYDADRTVLNMAVKWKSPFQYGSSTIDWLVDEEVTGSYVGRNAFNRAIKVQIVRSDHYTLSASAKSLNSINGSEESMFGNWFRTSVNMEAAEARRVKRSIRILVVCRLADNAMRFSKSRGTPTLDSPFDFYRTDRGLNVTLEELWFYDGDNGVVYSKLTRSSPSS